MDKTKDDIDILKEENKKIDAQLKLVNKNIEDVKNHYFEQKKYKDRNNTEIK